MSLRKNLTLIYASLLVSVLVAGASAQASAQLPKPGDAPAGSPVAKHGQLSVSGNTIKDKAGNDVVLRGVSFFWSNSDQSGWYNDAVVGWLVHDWNVSVVRAAMGVAEKDGGGNKGYADGDSSAQYGLVKNVVEAAIKRGIYVLVDWHSHSAQDYTSKATKFFENIARTYGAYPNIIYETYNEPTTDWGTIVNYSNTVTSAIRAIDSKNVIVIGTPGYSSQPNAGTASGTNLTYSMHFYSGSNDHRQPYRDRVSEALKNNKAVFVTEFGTCNYDGKGSHQDSPANDWISFLETNKVSWVNWAVSNKTTDGEATALFQTSAGQVANWTDSNKPTLAAQGTWSKAKIKSYNDAAYPLRTSYSITTTSEGEGSINRNNAGPSYPFGTSVTLTPAPASGWEFVRWEGDISGTTTPVTIRVAGINLNIKAVFQKGSMITNGHFTNTASTGWNVGGAAAVHEDETMRVNVNAGSSSGNVRQQNISLESGKNYTLKFRAKLGSGASGKSITPKMTNSNGDRNYFAGGPYTTNPAEPFELTTSWKEYSKTFEMCYRNNTGAVINDASAVLRIEFEQSSPAWTWYLDDVELNAVGTNNCQPSTAISVSPAIISGRTAWTLARTGNAVSLRGPAEHGAKVTLYDIRGKAVRTMNAKDGMTLGASIPAGNYFLVVRDAAGKEVLRDRVSLVR